MMKTFRYCYNLLRSCVCSCCKLPVACITWPCRCCRTPLSRRLAALYVFSFFIILPYLCHDVRYSIFFLQGNNTVAIAQMAFENTNRILAAEHYFDLLKTATNRSRVGKLVNEGTKPAVSVALTVITISRNRHAVDSYEPKYLMQVIWKFLTLLESEQAAFTRDGPQLDVKLSICNVDRDPVSYSEAVEMSQFVSMFARFNQTHFSTVHILEKEKQDYIFCLNRSLDSNPDYVFLVEDDAMPTDDIFLILQHVLEEHVERRFLRGEYTDVHENIAFIKFYHPERLLNFINPDRERMPELFSYVAVLGTILTTLYILCFRIDANVSVHVIWRKLSIFSLLVVLAVGRTGVSEWRRIASPMFYSIVPAPSCCTPALLFSSSTAKQTIAYLNATTCGNNYGKDSVLDDMLREKHMYAYLVHPNAFTHIGMYSSIRERIVDPFLV